MLRLDQEVSIQLNAAELSASVCQDDDDFFATQNTQTRHLAYLNDPSTDVHMLQKHPQIKELFIKYNTVLPSSAPVERLLSTASVILTKHQTVYLTLCLKNCC